MSSNKVYEKLLKCLESVRNKTEFVPMVAVVLGSGLGHFADDIKVVETISYEDIDGFPVSTVPGHAGKFIFGYVGEVPVVCMQGRVHYYEGYDISDVVLPTRLMHMMGAKILFLSNASGGINENFKAGDFMLLTDHISLFAPNPLIGNNIEELGTRFPDMTEVYDKELRQCILDTAKELSIDIKKGVYVQTTGPSFESPTEVKMLKVLGADAVGMSTVVEAIAARHCGMRVCCISCVCNLAAGISKTILTHEEVQQAGKDAGPKFRELVYNSIIKFK